MPNISIRPITEKDTPNILMWRNSTFVSSRFIYRQKITEEDHQKWMDTQIKNGKVAQFIIVSEDVKKDIGSVYLRDIDLVNQKAEFGIFIGDVSNCGKGSGSQATMLILSYAFETLGLNKVYLRVLGDNGMAVNCYKKIGFRTEGTFLEDVIVENQKVDIVFMAMLRKEWEALKCKSCLL